MQNNFSNNFSSEPSEPKFTYTKLQSPKYKKIKKMILYFVVFVFVLFFTFSITVIFSDESSFAKDGFLSNLKKLNLFKQLPQFISSDITKIKGYEEDNINFLLLGMGGGQHDGALLTDTIIIASYKPSTKKTAMLSIPRDLLVKTDEYGWRKINNINAFAEMKKAGSGSEAVAQAVSEIFDIPIHYYARIDFDMFIKMIDDLGGVDIYVDKSFTDYEYPADNYKYQTISFKNGEQHMNGDKALKFARSRHGNNGEGSDFARSVRQQKIITAVSKQIMSASTFLNPKKINNLLTTYHQNIQTNLEIWEALVLKDELENYKKENVIHQILDTSPENYLYEDIVNGAYVLQPKAGDWSDLRLLAANLFNPKFTEKEVSKIEVLNGTKTEGLAFSGGLILQNYGYDVIRMRNAVEQNYYQTTIYDLSNGKKTKTVNSLKKIFHAKIETNTPAWIERWQGEEWEGENKIFTKADIIIVLGDSSAKYVNERMQYYNRAKESVQKVEVISL
jgi:LCP family protein required for cell wall assembly